MDWSNTGYRLQSINPRDAILYYFYIQSPQGRASGTSQHLTFQEALANIREVRYDRGQLNDEKDREAQRMASATERLLSFGKSTLPADEALILSLLGFYMFETRLENRIKCSFCKRTFNYGMHCFTVLIN